jgi:hypothetical protein
VRTISIHRGAEYVPTTSEAIQTKAFDLRKESPVATLVPTRVLKYVKVKSATTRVRTAREKKSREGVAGPIVT